MNADQTVLEVLKTVPKALAAGVVDLDSGFLLAVKTTESHPQEILDFVSAATKEMFEGENVTVVESLFKKARGVTSDERYFKEILVTSKNLLHYFGRSAKNERVILCVVTQIDANLGLVMLKSKALAKELTI